MSTTTDVAFSDTDRRLAQHLKALAHPARLAIVRLLAERDECVCGEIVDDLPLAQSTVSQHLKALKEAGLVRGTVEGRSTCYCLDPEAVRALDDDLGDFFDGLSLSHTSQNCC
ncbi:MAG: ArsR/SmtB family transcription factor [Salinibacter sp.]